MSIKSISKSLATELMSTKEYKVMTKLKHSLYNNPELGSEMREYESRQLDIVNKNTAPENKRILLTNLKNDYKNLISSIEMKNYMSSIKSFQNKTMEIFQQLNLEIGKIINR